ncbi:Maf-like protein [Polynucleobacter sp. SHI8]|uniref:Maf family protein n=1 Tax=unclassified Polynucleobacter TaxID=2640945 RepID=UPI0024923CEA|nr:MULTISPECIES: Maf family protein [unclassified Polynucleobacter]BDW10454.1 Maf-like protein [Polynucleobacter sp. SHI2]BDW12900.1 Maf-like protein [Polynucleobacter sp. SHI8]
MLYLASQSPRRQAILNDLRVNFQLLLPDSSENPELLETVLPQEASQDYVLRVTLLKLQAAVERLNRQGLPWAPILCADTTVALTKDGKEMILGKPHDDNDALSMLELLNGQCHVVHTAIAIQMEQNQAPEYVMSSSKVYFANNSTQKLKSYVATNEPLGKAGAYAIQGYGSCLIEKIEGSHSAIMGLPIFETSRLLEKAGIGFILSP